MKNKIMFALVLLGLMTTSCEKLEINKSDDLDLVDGKNQNLRDGILLPRCRIADAAVSDITITSVVGNTFDYHFTVVNLGFGTLYLDRMYFQAYISEDAVLDAGDKPAGGSIFGDTAPALGYRETYTQSWYYNPTTPENITQYHYVIVQLNVRHKMSMPECRTDNNIGVKDIGCNLAEAITTAINISSVDFIANTFNYTFDVTNTGWGTLYLDRMFFQTYISKDAVLNAGDKPAGGSIFGSSAPALAKDQSYTQSWYYNPTTPEDLTVYKYLIIQLDVAYGSMPECSIDNNITSARIVIDIPRNGLVAFYPFNANANDESGNNLHGQLLADPTLTTDRFGYAGKAYSFDGTNDRIDVGNPVQLQITNTITLGAWVRNTSFSPYAQILSKVQSTNQSGTEKHGYNLLLISTGSGQQNYGATVYYPGYGPSGLNFSFGAPFTANEWVFFTFTLDGQNAKWYKNGVEVFSVNNHQPLTAATLGNFLIGSGEGGGFLFNGLIDDVVVYNRALTALEVQQAYNQNISQ